MAARLLCVGSDVVHAAGLTPGDVYAVEASRGQTGFRVADQADSTMTAIIATVAASGL
jgi:hypothetical protein